MNIYPVITATSAQCADCGIWMLVDDGSPRTVGKRILDGSGRCRACADVDPRTPPTTSPAHDPRWMERRALWLADPQPLPSNTVAIHTGVLVALDGVAVLDERRDGSTWTWERDPDTAWRWRAVPVHFAHAAPLPLELVTDAAGEEPPGFRSVPRAA